MAAQQQGDDSRQGDRGRPRQSVPGANRRARHGRPGAQRPHRDQPRRPRHRPGARRGAQSQGTARPAARHPGADQGQHRHRRPDDRPRRARWRWPARRAGRDAFMVQRLREAGAVILGKTNLSEWANFRSTAFDQRLERPRRADAQSLRPGPQSLRLQLRLAAPPSRPTCAPRRSAPRPTARSSAPSAYNGIVGIKPTVGLVSRAASSRSRTARTRPGPMARTVLTRPSCWARWPGPIRATAPPRRPRPGRTPDYTRFLDPGGTAAAPASGVARKFFGVDDRRRTR